MAITKKKIHDNCTVAVEWLDPNQNINWAKLICVDTNCTRKKKFVQWLNVDDAFDLVEEFNTQQINNPIPPKMITSEELGI